MSISPEGPPEPTLPTQEEFAAELARRGEAPLDTLWTELDNQRHELFENVRAHFAAVRDEHGARMATTWQAYYAGVQDGVDTRTWVVGRPSLGTLHIVVNGEHPDPVTNQQMLLYNEYVLSERAQALKCVRNNASKHPRDGWTESALLHCAFVHHWGHRVIFRRGDVNGVPQPENPYSSELKAEFRLDKHEQIMEDLRDMRQILQKCLRAGSYHEPGVTGIFE